MGASWRDQGRRSKKGKTEMSKYTVRKVIQQEATFDGEWQAAIDDYLLMKIINHCGAEGAAEADGMKNPKRFIVKITIETMDVQTPKAA